MRFAQTPVRAAGAIATAIAALFALAGCATYAPLPLPKSDDLAAAATVHAPPPLDMNAVATLAVLNNPDLRAARAKMHVAAAQAFAAGILPDPQVNASADHPTDRVNSPSDPRYPEYDAYGFGLGLDLRALLTYPSSRTAAKAAYDQAQEDLLWQEWQTVAAARVLFVAQAIGADRSAFLAPEAQLLARAAAHSQAAFGEGNVSLEQVSADQAALAAIQGQEGAAQRNLLAAEHGMRALLGLKPDVAVPLAPLTAPPIPDRAAVTAAAARLPRVRPDLRALQHGYRSQEAQVRIAVLSQFPNVVVGFTRARDFSNVHSIGGAVSLTLPLFDRGRGQIAIQRATRAQLRAEYQARLDQASSDIWQLWSDMQELRGELEGLDRRLPPLQKSVDNARRAYADGNFPAANYLALVNAYLAAQSSRFDVLQSLWTDSIALAALTGTQIEPTVIDRPDRKPL